MDNKSQDIKIAKVELLEWGIKLSDEKGMVFNLSEKTKDGRTSNAWEQYQNMGLKIGSVVNVWYAEVPNKHGGTSRYIRSFKETNGASKSPSIPGPTTYQKPKPVLEDVFIPQDEFMPEETTPDREAKHYGGNDAFGRRLALHGFVNARLQDNPIQQVRAEIDDLLALEDYIDSKLAS